MPLASGPGRYGYTHNFKLLGMHSKAVRQALKTEYPYLKIKVKIEDKNTMFAYLLSGNVAYPNEESYESLKESIEDTMLSALKGIEDTEDEKIYVHCYLGEPYKQEYIYKEPRLAESSAMTYNAEMDANVLFRQLGGNRFRAMTGAKDFMKDGNSLRMKIMKNNTGGNHLIITLNSNDLYDMRFESHRMNRKTYELTIKVKAEEKNIPASNLQRVFTELSGLYTHMAEQSFNADNKNPITQKMIYNMKQTLDSIWRSGDMDEVSIKHIWYSLGALGDGRDWNTQTDYTSMNDMNKVKRQWKKIQSKRDELGIENFKKLIELIPNYGSALSKRTISPDLAKIIGQTEIDGWDDFSAESFNAENNLLVKSYQKALKTLKDNNWNVYENKYTEDASASGLSESHSWAIEYDGEGGQNDTTMRDNAFKILEDGDWTVVWDNNMAGQGFIEWHFYSENKKSHMEAESFNADDLKFKEWADQEMKTHGKKESFDDWLDDELESHGDNTTLADWGHHELDSHYERYGAEDEQIELQGDDGPSYAWEDVYYNCPICDEELSIMGGKGRTVAICENGCETEYPRNMLESFDEWHWFHNVGAHENRRNDYKDPEESDGIPVCSICDFSQSYSPDNMVEKDDGSWKCQSCGEITESFNADSKGFYCNGVRCYGMDLLYDDDEMCEKCLEIGFFNCKDCCSEEMEHSAEQSFNADNNCNHEIMDTTLWWCKACDTKFKAGEHNKVKNDCTIPNNVVEYEESCRDCPLVIDVDGIVHSPFNAETKSLPYKWIAGAIALGISLPYISSLLNSGREK